MKVLRFLFSAAVILFLVAPAWGALPSYCDLPSIKEITVPLSNSDQGQSLKYKYQVVAVNPNAPTVIYLQGGPGASAIQDWGSPRGAVFYQEMIQPSHLNWIFIDARGMGCNSAKAKEIPPADLTTELTAADVVHVIENEHLNNYILYGTSYGTELGTMVAHLAEEKGLFPKSLVLDGTVGFGKPDRSGSEAPDRTRNWQVIRKILDPNVVMAIEGDHPLGVSSMDWGNYLYDQMAYGRYVENGQIKWPIKEHLSLIAGSDAQKAVLKQMATHIEENDFGGSESDDDDSILVARQVSCREIENYEYPIAFENGQFLTRQRNKIFVMAFHWITASIQKTGPSAHLSFMFLDRLMPLLLLRRLFIILETSRRRNGILFRYRSGDMTL